MLDRIEQINQEQVEDFRKVLRKIVKDTGNLPMLPGIRNTVDAGNAFIGYKEGKPVAILTVSEPKRQPDALKIDQLGSIVLRQGYAGEMFEYGLALAAARGKRRVIASTKKDNTPIHRLNEKYGMSVVGETATGKLAWEVVFPGQEETLF